MIAMVSEARSSGQRGALHEVAIALGLHPSSGQDVTIKDIVEHVSWLEQRRADANDADDFLREIESTVFDIATGDEGRNWRGELADLAGDVGKYRRTHRRESARVYDGPEEEALAEISKAIPIEYGGGYLPSLVERMASDLASLRRIELAARSVVGCDDAVPGRLDTAIDDLREALEAGPREGARPCASTEPTHAEVREDIIMTGQAEAELDSPNFVPEAAKELEKRGFERVNRRDSDSSSSASRYQDFVHEIASRDHDQECTDDNPCIVCDASDCVMGLGRWTTQAVRK
jgi:hypothetical protein